jgi:hypothetical protein
MIFLPACCSRGEEECEKARINTQDILVAVRFKERDARSDPKYLRDGLLLCTVYLSANQTHLIPKDPRRYHGPAPASSFG